LSRCVSTIELRLVPSSPRVSPSRARSSRRTRTNRTATTASRQVAAMRDAIAAIVDASMGVTSRSGIGMGTRV